MSALSHIEGLADVIAEVLGNLDLPSEADRLNVYRFLNASYSTPAAIIEVPDIVRTPVNAPESQLGHADWMLSFPISIRIPLGTEDFSQRSVLQYVEAAVEAFDSPDALINAGVVDAKITEASPDYEAANNGRPEELVYTLTLELLLYKPYA